MTEQEIFEAMQEQARVSRRGRKLLNRAETARRVEAVMPELVERMSAAPIVIATAIEA